MPLPSGKGKRHIGFGSALIPRPHGVIPLPRPSAVSAWLRNVLLKVTMVSWLAVLWITPRVPLVVLVLSPASTLSIGQLMGTNVARCRTRMTQGERRVVPNVQRARWSVRL